MDAPIFRLPPELMDPIWNQLDNPSRGYLALTCKVAYEYWKPIFDDLAFNVTHPGKLLIEITEEDWNYLGHWPESGYWYNIEVSRDDRDRSRFMQRIQTARYTYCQSCCKLHPHQEFEKSELQKPTDDKHCKRPGLINCRHQDRFNRDCMRLEQNLPNLPGGFRRTFVCSVSSAKRKDRCDGMVEVSYMFSLDRNEFVPDPQDGIRICPHICLSDLFFRGHVLDEMEIASKVICKECKAIAKVSLDKVGDCNECWISTWRERSSKLVSPIGLPSIS